MQMGVAVVGGGISGISAARDLANSGFKVYLIEKKQELGGKMSELAECKAGLSPWIAEVENHPNIELLLSSEVEDLTGSAGNFTLKVSGKEIEVASIVLAPGYDIFENVSQSYAVDHPDVVTSLEFERMLRASTKTTELLRPSNGKRVRRIGFIQCVGSRCTENELCSSVCCAYTAKEAKIIKQRFPDVDVHIFYMDIRVFGKDEELIDEITNDYNAKYVRSRVPEVIPEGETLTVKFENFEKGTLERLDLDLVVLVVGLRPSKSVSTLAEITGVNTDSFGYIETSFTNPLETNVPGIFVCGTANAPMKVQESVAQGSAAALKASLLSKSAERVEIEKNLGVIETGEEPRIGVFICGCEGEIGNLVDIPAVVTRMKNLPGVVYVNGELNTCEDAKNAIEREIVDQGLNRIVFAGCTPRGHETIFRNACAKAGLNPYLLEIANIREHCAWVHEQEVATPVAEELIAMSVERARHLEELPNELYPVTPKALVIGGGASGMTAALDIANAGYDVYLVEKEPELGGLLNTITELLTGVSASDVSNSLVAQIKDNARVTVYTNAEVADVWGRPGEFKARIRGERVDKEIAFGGAVLATVASESVPEGYFGYGRDKNIVTLSEFEKMLMDGTVEDATTLVMMQDGTPGEGVFPKQNSIKVVATALKVKELKPESNVFVVCQDIKTYGKWELLYREARESGVIFLRYDKERLPELKDGIISVHEVIFNDEVQLKPDLIVLSTLMKPYEGNEHLSELFKIPLNDPGFFVEARERPRMNLTPIETPTKGVFICGSAIHPTTLDECIVQASAAASQACSSILSKEYMAVEPLAARVDETLCRGCGVCEQLCEYRAITLEESNGIFVSVVNEALCTGCGACAVACPARAIKCKYFDLEQITSMIETTA
jgi:heterodisulfide reductase subunit A